MVSLLYRLAPRLGCGHFTHSTEKEIECLKGLILCDV